MILPKPFYLALNVEDLQRSKLFMPGILAFDDFIPRLENRLDKRPRIFVARDGGAFKMNPTHY